MIEGSGSIPLTSERPKNMWIRVRNTDKKTVAGRAREKKRCGRKYKSGYGQERKVSVTIYRPSAYFPAIVTPKIKNLKNLMKMACKEFCFITQE
jgi:hypothetical protein